MKYMCGSCCLPTLLFLTLVFGEKIPKMGTFSDFVTIFFIKCYNIDVVGDKPVKNDSGEMSMSEEAKQNAWA